MNDKTHDASPVSELRFDVRVQKFFVTFYHESLLSWSCGYAVLSAVLAFCQVSWIGCFVGFCLETIAAGYYLKVMNHQIHDEIPEDHYGVWPKLKWTDIWSLMRLGFWTNLIQVYFAAAALAVPVAIGLLLSVVCFGPKIVGSEEYSKLFLSANLLALPLSIWFVVILAPAGLARFAHSKNLRESLNIVLIHQSTSWDSDLVRHSAAIYCSAIVINVLMASWSPSMLQIFEPFIEFASMALVSRLNARFFRMNIRQSSDQHNQSK